MNAQRFTAIAFIFAVVSAAWAILGHAIDYRTDQLAQSLSREVDTMWGPAGIVQCTPCVLTGGITEMNRGEYDTPIQSDVDVSFEHHNRYKGLLWFSTYTVKFRGTYELGESKEDAAFLFKLPDNVHSLEEMTFTVDDVVVEPLDSTRHGVSNTLEVPVSAGARRTVEVQYTTRARDRWAYSSQWHTAGRPGLLRNFTLTCRADFADIDYPKGAVSPTAPAKTDDGGAAAVWQYKSMRANQTMGIEMPARTNAGPIAARMSFFAPVSLAFFFTVLFTVVVLKKLPLHPMHYLFISAGFFAFHILMAYLVDLISIHAAFWICAAVSTALVVSYMRLVAGVKFAVIYVAAAQVVYLVGFSYAFFWVGMTGLALTVGAIATLFVLMQATGKVDWNEVFRSSPDKVDQWATVPPLPDEVPPAPDAPDANDNG
ncbi:MAG: inner membrane CreD family protein [Phycisphaerae bacterium]|nr:inner membrane CreD family protein [Phycisphaerae bacterium]